MLEVNIPVMMMERGLSGVMAILLMDAVRGWPEVKEVLALTGQDFSGDGRKLQCNQNPELMLSRVEPVLVSRSTGLTCPGHQNHLSALDRAAISMTLVQ